MFFHRKCKLEISENQVMKVTIFLRITSLLITAEIQREKKEQGRILHPQVVFQKRKPNIKKKKKE